MLKVWSLNPRYEERFSKTFMRSCCIWLTSLNSLTQEIVMQYTNKFSIFKCVYELTRTQSNHFSRLSRLNLDKFMDIVWEIYFCHNHGLIEIHISDWVINFSPVLQSFGEWLLALLSVCLTFRFPSVSEEILGSHFNFVSQYWEFPQKYVQEIKLWLNPQKISGNLQEVRIKFMIIPWWSFEVEKIFT